MSGQAGPLLRRPELSDFEPPVGTERLEEFLDAQWGARAGRTLNKNLSILRDFFKFHVLRGKLHGDPTLAIERARQSAVYRTTFTIDQRRAILAVQPELRDRIALRLLLDYGLRKGALQKVQFKHFDHNRKRLTIFTKGQKVRDVPIAQPEFWDDLGRLIIETEAQPHHFLLPRRKAIPKGQAEIRRSVNPPVPRSANGRSRLAFVVVPMPRARRDRRRRYQQRRADARGPVTPPASESST